jgi:unsaturated chondroitin disaccharide hydrolase
MWGDYHIREAALLLQRLIENKHYYTFFGCLRG